MDRLVQLIQPHFNQVLSDPRAQSKLPSTYARMSLLESLICEHIISAKGSVLPPAPIVRRLVKLASICYSPHVRAAIRKETGLPFTSAVLDRFFTQDISRDVQLPLPFFPACLTTWTSGQWIHARCAEMHARGETSAHAFMWQVRPCARAWIVCMNLHLNSLVASMCHASVTGFAALTRQQQEKILKSLCETPATRKHHAQSDSPDCEHPVLKQQSERIFNALLNFAKNIVDHKLANVHAQMPPAYHNAPCTDVEACASYLPLDDMVDVSDVHRRFSGMDPDSTSLCLQICDIIQETMQKLVRGSSTGKKPEALKHCTRFLSDLLAIMEYNFYQVEVISPSRKPKWRKHVMQAWKHRQQSANQCTPGSSNHGMQQRHSISLPDRVPTDPSTKRTLTACKKAPHSSSPHFKSTIRPPATAAQGPRSSDTDMANSLTYRPSASTRPFARRMRTTRVDARSIANPLLPLRLRVRPSQRKSTHGGNAHARCTQRACRSVATDVGMTSDIDGRQTSCPLRLSHAKGSSRTVVVGTGDGNEDESDNIPLLQWFHGLKNRRMQTTCTEDIRRRRKEELQAMSVKAEPLQRPQRPQPSHPSQPPQPSHPPQPLQPSKPRQPPQSQQQPQQAQQPNKEEEEEDPLKFRDDVWNVLMTGPKMESRITPLLEVIDLGSDDDGSLLEEEEKEESEVAPVAEGNQSCEAVAECVLEGQDVDSHDHGDSDSNVDTDGDGNVDGNSNGNGNQIDNEGGNVNGNGIHGFVDDAPATEEVQGGNDEVIEMVMNGTNHTDGLIVSHNVVHGRGASELNNNLAGCNEKADETIAVETCNRFPTVADQLELRDQNGEAGERTLDELAKEAASITLIVTAGSEECVENSDPVGEQETLTEALEESDNLLRFRSCSDEDTYDLTENATVDVTQTSVESWEPSGNSLKDWESELVRREWSLQAREIQVEEEAARIVKREMNVMVTEINEKKKELNVKLACLKRKRNNFELMRSNKTRRF